MTTSEMDMETDQISEQEDLNRNTMNRENTNLNKTMRTLLVITAMEKGNPRTINVFLLPPRRRSRKTTYVRASTIHSNRMTGLVWNDMMNLYKMKVASILCKQAASTLFKVNGSQVKNRTPNREFDSLKSRSDSGGTWRLWTERSKRPTKRRSCAGCLGLNRARMKGKKKNKITMIDESRTNWSQWAHQWSCRTTPWSRKAPGAAEPHQWSCKAQRASRSTSGAAKLREPVGAPVEQQSFRSRRTIPAELKSSGSQ